MPLHRQVYQLTKEHPLHSAQALDRLHYQSRA
jgi:hypothetical protein